MKPINEMTLEECLDVVHKLGYEKRLAIVNRLRELNEKHRWIPVEERLPTKEDADPHGAVLVRIIMRGCPEPLTDTWQWDRVEAGIPNLKPTHWRRIDTP